MSESAIAFFASSEELGLPLEEMAYRRLREALVSGAVLPGDRLSIRGVAASLGVSAMPARTALRRLAAEQALDMLPSGTAVVPRLTRAGFAELSAVRAELEPLAVRLAAAHLTDADRDLLATLVAAHDAARADADAAQAADREFLFRIYRAARAPLLLGLIETLWLRRGPLFRSVGALVAAAGGLRHHHGAILEALRAGDGETAAALLRREIEEATRFIQSTARFEGDDTAAERLAAIGRAGRDPDSTAPVSLSQHRGRTKRPA
ncbi:GntR family transcriptional regulator [Roseomonas sp. F4]